MWLLKRAILKCRPVSLEEALLVTVYLVYLLIIRIPVCMSGRA